MANITKKEYEEYLNEAGVPKHDDYRYGGRCKSINYGTWMRKKDPLMFAVGYNEYVQNELIAGRR